MTNPRPKESRLAEVGISRPCAKPWKKAKKPVMSMLEEVLKEMRRIDEDAEDEERNENDRLHPRER